MLNLRRRLVNIVINEVPLLSDMLHIHVSCTCVITHYSHGFLSAKMQKITGFEATGNLPCSTAVTVFMVFACSLCVCMGLIPNQIRSCVSGS